MVPIIYYRCLFFKNSTYNIGAVFFTRIGTYLYLYFYTNIKSRSYTPSILPAKSPRSISTVHPQVSYNPYRPPISTARLYHAKTKPLPLHARGLRSPRATFLLSPPRMYWHCTVAPPLVLPERLLLQPPPEPKSSPSPPPPSLELRSSPSTAVGAGAEVVPFHRRHHRILLFPHPPPREPRGRPLLPPSPPSPRTPSPPEPRSTPSASDGEVLPPPPHSTDRSLYPVVRSWFTLPLDRPLPEKRFFMALSMIFAGGKVPKPPARS